MEADFQSLDTLASFFTIDLLEDREAFADGLDTSNKQNNFAPWRFSIKMAAEWYPRWASASVRTWIIMIK